MVRKVLLSRCSSKFSKKHFIVCLALSNYNGAATTTLHKALKFCSQNKSIGEAQSAIDQSIKIIGLSKLAGSPTNSDQSLPLKLLA